MKRNEDFYKMQDENENEPTETTAWKYMSFYITLFLINAIFFFITKTNVILFCLIGWPKRIFSNLTNLAAEFNPETYLLKITHFSTENAVNETKDSFSKDFLLGFLDKYSTHDWEGFKNCSFSFCNNSSNNRWDSKWLMWLE